MFPLPFMFCFPAPTRRIQMNSSLSGFCRGVRTTCHLNQVCRSRETPKQGVLIFVAADKFASLSISDVQENLNLRAWNYIKASVQIRRGGGRCCLTVHINHFHFHCLAFNLKIKVMSGSGAFSNCCFGKMQKHKLSLLVCCHVFWPLMVLKQWHDPTRATLYMYSSVFTSS